MSERDIPQSGEEQESEGLERGQENIEEQRALEESTHEPGARIEESSDIQEAEAIEANLVQLVDGQSPEYVEGQVLSADNFEEEQEYYQEGSGGKSAFGSETSDPQKHYTGVEMKQGEVLQDDDWNEEGDTSQKLEDSFDKVERMRQVGLEDLIDLQDMKENSLEEEKERLEDKYGSDTPRSLEFPPIAETLNEEGQIKVSDDISKDPAYLKAEESISKDPAYLETEESISKDPAYLKEKDIDPLETESKPPADTEEDQDD
jgi:hypothetical protein